MAEGTKYFALHESSIKKPVISFNDKEVTVGSLIRYIKSIFYSFLV